MGGRRAVRQREPGEPIRAELSDCSGKPRLTAAPPNVVCCRRLWHSTHVRSRIYRRWCLVLGMIAMLGAVLSVPLSAAHAFQLAASHDAQQTAAVKQDMPCHNHKPVKADHCPNCPQKTCPDLGSCLVKCFQQLTPLPVDVRLQADMGRDRIPPAAAHESAGTLTPQLLRPPRV